MVKKAISTSIGILASTIVLTTVLLARIEPLNLKRTTFSFQVHTTLPTDPAFYVHANDKTLKQCSVDLSSVNTTVMATYPAYIDYKGQRYEFSIVVEDTVPPKLQLKDGQTVVSCFLGQKVYAKDLVTVVDDSDVNVLFKLENGDTVSYIEIEKEGRKEYRIVAIDASGNEQSPVRVILDASKDTTKPVISGIDPTSVKQNSKFNPLEGVSANDNVDGDLTSQIKVTGQVDVRTIGEYLLTYEVEDTSHNKTVVTRKIIVNQDGQSGQNDIDNGPFLTTQQVASRNQKVEQLMKNELNIFADYKFIEALNAYLTSHFEISEEASSSYDVLCQGQGNRIALSRATKVILDARGLENYIVYGKQKDMVWNMVKIGNNYRHLDIYGNYISNDLKYVFLKKTSELDSVYDFDHTKYPICK